MRLFLAIFVGAFGSTVRGDITFGVTFQDIVQSTGEGFDDPVFGADRVNTFNSALSYINTVFDESGSFDIDVQLSESDGTGPLATGGTFFFTSPARFTNGLGFAHATTGNDPLLGNADAFASFDFGFNYNNTLASPAAGQFDLFTVALHELSHGFGFISLTSSTGVSQIGSMTDPGVFTVFDSFLEDGSGNSLFAAGGDFVGDTSDLVSDDLFFGGANAVAANGGNPVEVFAPTTFLEGSSLSHIVTPSPSVLNFSIAAGSEIREFNDVELAVFQDLGYTLAVTAVPEPSVVVFGSVCCLGVTLRRRRRR
ncbi:MAG: hypothetical protein AAF664_10075 [Planctomycetota bacterium]